MYSVTNGFRLTGAIGLTMVVLGILVTFYYPPLPGAMVEGFSLSIIALEFAPSLSTASALFNGDTSLIHTYQTGHQLDMAYLLSYGAFLALANLTAWHLQQRGLSLIGVIAAGIASSADFAENLQLMQLTQALLGSGSAPDFWLLRMFVSTKFLMITVSLLCLLPIMWQRQWLGKIFCAATLLAAPATLLTLSGYYHFSGAMGGLIMVAWICLLIWVIKARNGVKLSVDSPKNLTKQHAV